MPDLLDEIDKKSVSEFHKDFSELIRVTVGIDTAYKMLDPTLNSYEDEYKKLVKLFARKYSGIALKTESRGSVHLRIFIKSEKSLKEIFLKVASRISGIKSIGINQFDEAQVTDSSKVSKAINSIKDKLYLTYNDPEHDTFTLFLKDDKQQKKIEIVYDVKTAADKFRPEFKLIAYYSLKSEYKKNIDFAVKASAIGFVRVFTDDERNQWVGDFNPRMNDFG